MMRPVFWNTLSHAVFDETVPIPDIAFNGYMPGPLPVTALLAETVALAGTALTRLTGQPSHHVHVDARLCAFWGQTSCSPIGWVPPEPWDPFSAAFKGRDGWIRLHTNAPHHKSAAMRVLGAASTKDEVAAAISALRVTQLEQEIIDAGGAAAQMISWQNWQEHPQGREISRTPLVEWCEKPTESSAKLRNATYDSTRPLAGLRVLDLTRVLAGPVATRTLAGYGADVLRIDPISWDDPGLLQDTTIGKYRSGLDLKQAEDRAKFEALLTDADVLVHGYRPGALDGLGYDQAAFAQLNPSLIDISLSAYGWRGPWATRRGFDSLVQFSSGIADLYADDDGAPGKLPVQALDHAAGYIMAACCLEGLRAAKKKSVMSARTALARIAWLLCEVAPWQATDEPIPPQNEGDFVPTIETSDWGDLKRLRSPLMVETVPMLWDVPAGELRKHPACWPS
jgi:hypothetical protein